jgi:mannose-1-phosphate guanylyltransferase
MKAMILAAGQGTRMRPLTLVAPKPMLPLLGKPVMEYLVEHLRAHGFTEIVVNTSYLSEQIETYFGDGRRLGVDMAYSFEGAVDGQGQIVSTPIGSAGGMRRIQDFSGFFDSTFVVLCGDAIIDVDLTKAVAAHRASDAIATLVAKPVGREEVSSYGIVVTAPGGRVVSFQEKPRPDEAKSNLANTGIYIFEPEVFDFIPAGEAFDIGSQLFPKLIEARAPFFATELPFEWVDIGNTRDYWDASMRVLRGEVRSVSLPGREIAPGVRAGINVSVPADCSGLVGPIWIGGSARIESGATVIGPAVIGPGSVIERGAVVEQSVVWNYTRVAGSASLRNMVVCGPHGVASDGRQMSWGDLGLGWAIDDARSLEREARPFDIEDLPTVDGEAA